MPISIPETNHTPADQVMIDPDGLVFYQGALLGRVYKGSYTYAPPVPGQNYVRFRKLLPEWRARAYDTDGKMIGREFRGSEYGSWEKKNTRQAAIAFLMAVRSGAERPRQFSWSS